MIFGSEECDDGNLALGDGCNSGCKVEEKSKCSGEPSECERCGNGIIEGSEECEDGNIENGDGCSENCKAEPGWICSLDEPSVC